MNSVKKAADTAAPEACSKVPRSCRAMLATLWLLLGGWASAQDTGTLFQKSSQPSTVVDYFIFCPYLDYLREPEDEVWLRLGDEPVDHPASQYLAKQLLLQGVPRDIRHQPNLVVDVRNGYVHVTLGSDDVTLVYYERADKSRIVGLRHEDRRGQFWTAAWRFFDVEGERWTPLDRDSLLPPEWLNLYLPKTLTQTDRDGLSLTDFDIDLPRFGTTAHLLPLRHESDLDSRTTKLSVPGTSRTMTLGTYWDWYERSFGDRALELRWNKPSGRFDAGKVAKWTPPSVPPEKPRSLYDVYRHPRNIWESFLAAPDLVFAGESGLRWDPNGFVLDEELRDSSRDAEQPYEPKQEIVTWGAWGEMRPRGELIVDLPNRYLSIDVAQRYWDRDADDVVEGESLVLTMAGFETAVKSTVIGYRFWGRTLAENPDSPKTEHNQVAAVFYSYSPAGDPLPLNEPDILPMKELGALLLPGAAKLDQSLQSQVIWDVVLPRGSGPLLLTPWRLAYGADERLVPAFDAFVKRWYSGQAVALDWNPKTARFEKPRLVKR